MEEDRLIYSLDNFLFVFCKSKDSYICRLFQPIDRYVYIEYKSIDTRMIFQFHMMTFIS